MSIKSILSFLVGCVLAAILLTLVAPFIGIPRSHLLPPPVVYSGATGRAEGVIVGKHMGGTRNPFRVGDKTYFLDYQFRAPAPATLGVKRPGVATPYKGTVMVDQRAYNATVYGTPVPIRYEKTYPYISGIASLRNGRSIGEGSALLSGWLLWAFVSVVFGFLLASVLYRAAAHENI